MTKFLVLCGDSEYAFDNELKDESLRGNIYYNEEPYMTVVECVHPEFTDNCIEVEDRDGNEFTCVRTKDGMLIYITQWMDKIELVNKFE